MTAPTGAVEDDAPYRVPYARFWKGVSARRGKLTRDPKIWKGYLAWWLHANLDRLPQMLHGRWYRFAAKLLPWFTCTMIHAGEDSRLIIRRGGDGMPLGGMLLSLAHQGLRSAVKRRIAPLGKLVGVHVARCDWTDPEQGLLYGGPGGSTERMFDQFLRNIEPTADQRKTIRAAKGTGEVN